MKRLAEGVWQLSGALPIPNAINTYVVEDVLIDAGARFDTKKILRQLRGLRPSAHALTHAHPDHQGASRAVCEEFEIPFWVSEADAPVAERPELMHDRQPDNLLAQFFVKHMRGPGHHVDRELREGDVVGGFEVLSTPGHSAGHVAYWRASDRVLILGDVLANMDVVTGIPGLTLPKSFLTPDPATNRVSAKRLGELEPSLVLFGHGKPLRDTRRFVEFCAAL